jgi:RNA-directed DNA polymerase
MGQPAATDRLRLPSLNHSLTLDLVVLHRDRPVIAPCRQLTQAWRQDMGLELSEQKTRIAHPLATAEGEAGFNCLGCRVRQYRASQDNTSRGRGFKTLIKPSQEAVKRHGTKRSEIITQNKAATQAHLIGVLHPSIAGWANDYRAVVRTMTVHRLDRQRYEKLRRWAFFRHPRQGRRWAIQR